MAFDFHPTSYKTYLQPAAIIELARGVKTGSCRSCKHYCTHFTENMVFAMMPQDSRCAITAAFPGSQDLKRHRAWGVFNQLQAIKNARKANSYLLTHSPCRGIPRWPHQAPNGITKSHVRHFPPEKDQGCLLNDWPSETEQTLKQACWIMPKSQD